MSSQPSSSTVSAREALCPPVLFQPQRSSYYVAKREESELDPTEPIIVSSRSPSPEPRSTIDSRQRLFHSLELGEYVLRDARSIETADDLDEVELKRCFDILHACGLATDSTTTLASTRDTMEDFLNAVFGHWNGSSGDVAKPTMDFIVREHINVGNVCGKPTRINTPHAQTPEDVKPLSMAWPHTKADQPDLPSASRPKNPPKTPAKKLKTCSVLWNAPIFAGKTMIGWPS
ncbi:hypothetical protein FHETE_6145 [Fusarium heterosporum]|uniref:Uncharacterized protein n=1 Tax=Fusarium heterosporum TaxID=42747 RepID=A0A8H5WNR9_FUSHE|nr:hypothetical protein FHETE_6145 [Fusarium heterosporum]